MKKLIINVRINEWNMRKTNKNIPYSVDEIAECTARCREAGASICHVHARGPNGEKKHDPALYTEIIKKIQSKSDILIHTTLGNVYNEGDDQTRMAHVAAAKPDIATIDIGSTNMDYYDKREKKWVTKNNVYINSIESCMYFAKKMKELKIKPSLGLWTVAFVRQAKAFMDIGLIDRPALAIIPLCADNMVAGHQATPEGLEAFFHALPTDGSIQWCVATKDANIFKCAAIAIMRGGHVAPGLGDYLYPELGFPSNEDIVSRIGQMAKNMNREIATPNEVKEFLNMNI